MSKYLTILVALIVVLLIGSLAYGMPVSKQHTQTMTILPSEYKVDSNTIGLWHFDEGTGTTTYDETINNNDGTLQGDAVFTPKDAPLSGSAYAISCDGDGDYDM